MASLPCPDCGSSDGLERYPDGHTHCFVCEKTTFPEKTTQQNTNRPPPRRMIKSKLKMIPFEDLFEADLEERGIKKETLNKYGYKFGKLNGKTLHVANYYWKNKLVAQHFRGADKVFLWAGKVKQLELFGQRHCGGRKTLIITEGELDALSILQVFGGAQLFDVVSVPSGAPSAKKYITQNLEFVERYETVILCLDNDKEGKKATKELSEIISAGKVKIVCFPADIKDASDLLQQKRRKELKDLVFNAAPYRPDGIISASDVSLAELKKPISAGIPYRYPKFQEKTFGGRKREITLWTAGSGIGKTTIIREIAYDYVRNQGLKVGMVLLEENKIKTIQGFVALDNNVPLANLRYDPEIISDEQYQDTYNRLIKSNKIYLYDHFGSLEGANLLAKLKYMAVALGVDFIFLDHISIVVSGNKTTDERKDIDILMTSLRTLCESTGVGIHAVVHLKREGNSDFNQGAAISLKHLRGSGSLEQISDNVAALERNQQAESEEERNQIQIRLLKCREVGDLGVCDLLNYNRETGRLELSEDYSSEEHSGFTVVNQETFVDPGDF